MPRRVILDANLLLLLVVGGTDRDYIERHKRLRAYESRDYDLLCEAIAGFGEIVVTPNVLTETSNLLRQDRRRSQLSRAFALVVQRLEEAYRPSAAIVGHAAHTRLGLTDCGLLDLAESADTLLTADLDLYLTALSAGMEALNFSHLRERAFGL